MKKTKLKRKSKSELAKIQEKLWENCKNIIRSRYRKGDKMQCFTCDNEVIGSGAQTGHFIPRSVGGALLRYHLDNLRIQCYRCNINLSGNGSEFYRRLVEEMGQEHVDNLFKLKDQTVNAKQHYLKLIDEYEEILKELE